ncbi:anti-sigma factor [Hydrogenophaga sp.]|uniref:anti-sigma factor family protein n=1 Tax=Hydrogenophaga sp. TaxID=1904254 RepID=UPI0026288606|nr:anti-sigma factor [Hydrogenophaga sp.]MCW5655755.1 anti-sigma factor [Hydrogenophaga sp.]
MDTSSSPHAPLTDAEIHALVDGQVPAAERAALESRLAHDTAGRERFTAWEAQRQALRGLYRDLHDDHDVPEPMRDAVLRMADTRQRAAQWQRWGGLAAGVLLAFAAGWLARAQWSNTATERLARHTQPASPLPVFARDAALAHAVFSAEKRHPVEVSAADQTHLVQWLSRRTGRELKVPNLSTLGYELVGGRLLPGDAGARAQFMFQDTQGVRITLYLGALSEPPGGQPASPLTSKETAFRFTDEGPVPGFYWVDQGFGYALSGPLSRAALMTLAEAVYRQL